MKTSIVLGLLFGDEGKGLITSCLANKGDLVVRFNGGAQAGHTVEKGSHRHVFSSFGSGTLNDAHTYWSEYCALYPKSYYNEHRNLTENGFEPLCFVNPLSPVITPFDIDHNRNEESVNRHGSVGMGFGSTMNRHHNTPYKLFAVELKNRNILYHKIKNIATFYAVENPKKGIDSFMDYSDAIDLNCCNLSEIKSRYQNIVFEGAQGIMLDMDFGYFPNVTRSNTTSKNALQVIKENDLPLPEIFYCMRSYLTRHGNGYMPNETDAFHFEDKTNISHTYQGSFRQGYHSLDLIKHALNCDNAFSFNCSKNLVVTCLNQTSGSLLIDNEMMRISVLKELGMPIHGSYSPSSFEKINDNLKVA